MMKLKQLKITPTLAVAGTYAANDQVGGLTTITNGVDSSGGQSILRSLVILDGAKQSLALDLFFFDQDPSLTSIDNGAFALLDADLLGKCLGVVSIVAADYAAVSASSVATKQLLSLVLQAAATKKDLYCVLVTRGAPTYADGDLKIILGLEPS